MLNKQKNSTIIPNMRIEHRLSQRIPFREPIKYGLNYPAFSGYTFDLSEGGIGIITGKVFPPDTELVFDMYMGEGVRRVEGIVARVTPILSGAASIMGLKITGHTDDIKHIYMQRLNKLPNSNKATEYD